MQSEPTPGRDENGRYTTGNPGRPKGAVNRMSSRVANGILNDFEANHTDVLAYLRIHHPTAYATLVGRVIGKSRFVEDDDLEPLVANVLSETIAKGARAVKAFKKAQLVHEMDYEAKCEAPGPDHSAGFAHYLRQFYDEEMAERTEAYSEGQGLAPRPSPAVRPRPALSPTRPDLRRTEDTVRKRSDTGQVRSGARAPVSHAALASSLEAFMASRRSDQKVE